MIKSATSKLTRLLGLLISLALFCVIAGCGNDAETTATGEATTGIHISSFTGSPASLSAGQSAILTVNVADSEGNPVQNATVDFGFTENNSGASLMPVSSVKGTKTAVKTDSNGQALAIYKAGSSSNALAVEDTVFAYYSGSKGALVITRTAGASNAYNVSLTASSTSVAAGKSCILTATVKNGSGAAVPGQAVTFSFATNNSSGTIAILGTGTTDSGGTATAVYRAGATSPAEEVYDNIQASITGSASAINITRLSSNASGLYMDLTADRTALSAGESTIVTAMVKDGDGNPVSGKSVNFDWISNNTGGSFATIQGATDVNGKATALYTAGSSTPSESVQDILSASLTGCSTEAIIMTRTLGSSSGRHLTLTAQKTILDAGQSTVITAQVTNGSVPVQGEPVTFSFLSGGNLSGATLSTLSGITDANGELTTVYTAGSLTAATVEDIVQAGISGSTKAVIITKTGSSGSGTTSNGSLVLSVSSSVVSYGTPVTASATLTDADGLPVPNAVVTFTTESSLVTFTPASATALTNASGIASVSLDTVSVDSAGATYISSSAPIYSGGSSTIITSSPVGIAVNGAAITLGTVTLGSSTISSYGTSSVSVPVLINGSPATVPISVNFTSSCVASGKATLSSPVTSNAVSGTAYSTYKDNNCNAGSDVITASVVGGAHASATITVLPPATSNIKFISASPEVIGTSTASSSLLSKSSVVKFQVVDNNNYGKSGVGVTFSILPANYSSFGITFTPETATSDADGYVTTSVTSGTVPTPVWVVASVTSTPAIYSQSNTLTITTGLPTQNFFSLGVSTLNIEGWIYDGETSSLTIIASDRLGNPVPDGTVINFITEGSNISNGSSTASCTTANGTCTVTFTSAEFRPTNGRVTVLAYAVGEKSFVDANGNNSYDSGERFYDIGDIYIDSNESGTWNASEQYISYTSGSNACRTRPSGTALPTSYDSSPSKQNTCTEAWGINYVRREAVMVLSGSYAGISLDSFTMGDICSNTFTFMMFDENNNPMPAGTTVTTAANNISYTYTTGSDPTHLIGEAVLSVGGTPVVSTNYLGGTGVSLTVSGGITCTGADSIINYPNGTVNLVITTPNGNITTIPITVN